MKNLTFKLLLLVLFIGLSQIKPTNAFFSNSEASTGNTMTAGFWGPTVEPELKNILNNFMLNRPNILIPSQEPETTITPIPSLTPEPTSTPEPTLTPTPTDIPAPTSTPAPTNTPVIGDQALIPTPTPTPALTPIPTPSQTSAPTVTIEPTDIVDGGTCSEE